MLKRLFRLYKVYSTYETGKFIYTKLLKPAYEELRKDAYAADTDKRTRNRNKKKGKKNAINKRPKRSNRP